MDPLIGVRVSHENHLEEGFTLTRPNGLFDFVCNCNSSISVKLKFGRSPFPFVEKSFYAFSNMVSEKVSTFRGNVSYELFFQSGDMSNLAYIGAKNLNF